MNIPEEEIEQVKAWKKIPKPGTRAYHCPFHVSKLGGEICEKAFKRCLHNPTKFGSDISKIKNLKGSGICLTEPCPCYIYGWSYIMMQANRIAKYGRI